MTNARNRLALLAVLILLACGSIAAARPQSIKAQGRQAVVGSFGQPLGQVARFTATLVENPGIKISLSGDPFRLKVTHVDGVTLRQPVVIDFTIHPFGKDLMPIHHSASDSKSRLQQLRLVESKQPFRFLAYETGSFRGAPVFPKELRGTKSARSLSTSANLPFRYFGRLNILEPISE